MFSCNGRLTRTIFHIATLSIFYPFYLNAATLQALSTGGTTTLIDIRNNTINYAYLGISCHDGEAITIKASIYRGNQGANGFDRDAYGTCNGAIIATSNLEVYARFNIELTNPTEQDITTSISYGAMGSDARWDERKLIVPAATVCSLSYEPVISMGKGSVSRPFSSKQLASGGNGIGDVLFIPNNVNNNSGLLKSNQDTLPYYITSNSGDILSWDAGSGGWTGTNEGSYSVSIPTVSMNQIPGEYSGTLSLTLICP
ncbi:hypothetical protein ACED16_01310 [Enterobacter hormaechei]